MTSTFVLANWGRRTTWVLEAEEIHDSRKDEDAIEAREFFDNILEVGIKIGDIFYVDTEGLQAFEFGF